MKIDIKRPNFVCFDFKLFRKKNKLIKNTTKLSWISSLEKYKIGVVKKKNITNNETCLDLRLLKLPTAKMIDNTQNKAPVCAIKICNIY